MVFHLLVPVLLMLTPVVSSENGCSPIYVRWPRVRLNLTSRVTGPYSLEDCAPSCSKDEHPARPGYPLQCSGLNHKHGASSLTNDCQLFQKDQVSVLEGNVEYDDRYSFYWKYCIKEKQPCKSPYQFDFYIDRYMDYNESQRRINTHQLEECLEECLAATSFECRSVSFNRTAGYCYLSGESRLSKPTAVRINGNPNYRIDYYENKCYNDSFTFHHECQPNGVLVSVESKFPYTGAMYGLYDYFSCRIEPKEETKFHYFFPFASTSKNCSDSMSVRDGEYVLEVVLSTDNVVPLYFLTDEDTIYKVKCPADVMVHSASTIAAQVELVPPFSRSEVESSISPENWTSAIASSSAHSSSSTATVEGTHSTTLHDASTPADITSTTAEQSSTTTPPQDPPVKKSLETLPSLDPQPADQEKQGNKITLFVRYGNESQHVDLNGTTSAEEGWNTTTSSDNSANSTSEETSVPENSTESEKEDDETYSPASSTNSSDPYSTVSTTNASVDEADTPTWSSVTDNLTVSDSSSSTEPAASAQTSASNASLDDISSQIIISSHIILDTDNTSASSVSSTTAIFTEPTSSSSTDTSTTVSTVVSSSETSTITTPATTTTSTSFFESSTVTTPTTEVSEASTSTTDSAPTVTPTSDDITTGEQSEATSSNTVTEEDEELNILPEYYTLASSSSPGWLYAWQFRSPTAAYPSLSTSTPSTRTANALFPNGLPDQALSIDSFGSIYSATKSTDIDARTDTTIQETSGSDDSGSTTTSTSEGGGSSAESTTNATISSSTGVSSSPFWPFVIRIRQSTETESPSTTQSPSSANTQTLPSPQSTAGQSASPSSSFDASTWTTFTESLSNATTSTTNSTGITRNVNALDELNNASETYFNTTVSQIAGDHTSKTTSGPPKKILFEVYHNGQTVSAVVVGSRITLTFIPSSSLPGSYVSLVGCQVEPVNSPYAWERDPLQIVKNGCQADGVGLVCPPVYTDTGVKVEMEAFRYTTTGEVLYSCLIRICPYGPCPQPACSNVDGCNAQGHSSGIALPPTFPNPTVSFGKRRKRQQPGIPALSFLPINADLQQRLISLAGDHLVTKTLVVVNSETDLEYYLKTGNVPNANHAIGSVGR